ncbi:Hsp20/alpha crystallin family protein [Catenulispora rubra]|uniref:Hsp20/alpha crystallin family protein n=1 Tax=Catenulispora rubra TaxID=280293 RepID=UPI0018925E97|nr:Hsp20/alpha crystallin family protein [Catenulispora rubra]
MAETSRRNQFVPLSDLRDLFDPFVMLDWCPKLVLHPIRVEDRFEPDGIYVLSAEIPGIDPEHDVELVVSEGTLSVRPRSTD